LYRFTAISLSRYRNILTFNGAAINNARTMRHRRFTLLTGCKNNFND
jgi:hypothetical protein